MLLCAIAAGVLCLGLMCPKPGAVQVPVTGVKVESGAVKGIDLGQLKEIQAKLEAQAADISGLKSSIKTGNITTGGTTHIVLLVLGLALIGAYFHGLHAHSKNKKEITRLKSAINPLRPDESRREEP